MHVAASLQIAHDVDTAKLLLATLRGCNRVLARKEILARKSLRMRAMTIIDERTPDEITRCWQREQAHTSHSLTKGLHRQHPTGQAVGDMKGFR